PFGGRIMSAIDPFRNSSSRSGPSSGREGIAISMIEEDAVTEGTARDNEVTVTKGGSESMPVTESRQRQLVETLKHPLILLLLGSVLTYLIWPAVTSKVNHRQAIRDLKLKKASEIGANHIEFNSKFNVLRSVLETFHDNQIAAKPTREEFKAAQKDLDKTFNDRQCGLTEKEWWWYRDIQRETTINKLIPPEAVETLNNSIAQYHQNITDAHKAILPLWQALKAPDYNPGDEETEKKI